MKRLSYLISTSFLSGTIIASGGIIPNITYGGGIKKPYRFRSATSKKEPCTCKETKEKHFPEPNPDPTYITIIADDDTTFSIDKNCAQQIPTINNMFLGMLINDTDDDGNATVTIPLPSDHLKKTIALLASLNSLEIFKKKQLKSKKCICKKISATIEAHLESNHTVESMADIAYCAEFLELDFITKNAVSIIMKKLQINNPQLTITKMNTNQIAAYHKLAQVSNFKELIFKALNG